MFALPYTPISAISLGKPFSSDVASGSIPPFVTLNRFPPAVIQYNPFLSKFCEQFVTSSSFPKSTSVHLTLSLSDPSNHPLDPAMAALFVKYRLRNGPRAFSSALLNVMIDVL